MAATFQVNISITAGAAFSQQFTITNSDMTPTDLTGYTFSAYIAKHEEALNAVKSTSAAPVWKFLQFTTTVTTPASGVYTINLTPEQSEKLEEGKYVYSVVMTDTENVVTEVVKGLAFVNKAFGNFTVGTLDTDF